MKLLTVFFHIEVAQPVAVSMELRQIGDGVVQDILDYGFELLVILMIPVSDPEFV